MKPFVFLACYFFAVTLAAQDNSVDSRIDQMRYWMKLAQEGKVPYNLLNPVRSAVYRSDIATPWGELSPDVRMGDKGATRSENSITILPGSSDTVHCGNNLSDYPVTWLFGTDALNSGSGGRFWNGEVEGAGGDNNGDPAVDADLHGRIFSGRIARNRGQAVAWSDDYGKTWNQVQVASPSFSSDIFDKNHLCVDRSLSSPFSERVYVAWSYFGSGPDDGHVFLSYSPDRGLSWSDPQKISGAVNDVFLHHGVNLHTGPDGDVYAVWSVYDNWPGDESALVFAHSSDGGVTFSEARRIGVPIRGNRHTLSPKNMRMNAFPVMSVDCSQSPYRGTITVVWSNKGFPGNNSGENSDIYAIQSFDHGITWSSPLQITNNNAPEPHTSFFPWLCSDDETGNLFMIYYDDRNTDTLSCETWVASSLDGGASWLEFPVSDVAFTPQPIQGMAASYFGDYIGITASHQRVYPVWTDNRDGVAASWCSPFSVPSADEAASLMVRRWWFDGSGNGFINAGDSVQLNLVLVNKGTRAIDLQECSVLSLSSFCSVENFQWPSTVLFPGDSVVVAHVATVFASPLSPNLTEASVQLVCNEQVNVLSSRFYFQLRAPALKSTGYAFVSESLHSNGVPDAGETVVVSFGVANCGSFDFKGGSVLFNDASAQLSVLPTLFQDVRIESGDTAFFTLTMQWPVAADTGDRFSVVAVCESGVSIDTLHFVFRTSVLREDWESASLSQLPWSLTPDQPWRIDSAQVFEGRFSLRSASPPDQGRSLISLSYYVARPDSITFWLRTSSEQNYDVLTFRIGNNDVGTWSGRTEWTRFAALVDSGFQTFSWIYSKDLFNGLWDDCAWIDDICFPALAPAIVQLSDTAICRSDTAVVLKASGNFYNRLRWKTEGDGFFRFLEKDKVIYYLGNDDLEHDSVVISSTALGNLNQPEDSMVLFVQSFPQPPAATVNPGVFCSGATAFLELTAPPLPFHECYWYMSSHPEAILNDFRGFVSAPDASVALAVEMSNMCGFSNRTVLPVLVHQNPEIKILASDTILYPGQVIKLWIEPLVAAIWSTGDTVFEVEIDQHLVSGQGSYFSVAATDSLGCLGVDSVFVQPGSGYATSFKQLKIWQHGGLNSISVECTGCSLTNGLLQIFDSRGQLVYLHKYLSVHDNLLYIRLPLLSSGLYIVRLVDEGGIMPVGKFFQ